MFLSSLKVFTALIRPMVPMEIRSSTLTPALSNRRAMYTTSRRFRSMRMFRASWLPAAYSCKSRASSHGSSGGGKTSLPPM